jgi:hypothetical protein
LIHGGYELPLLLEGRKKLARFEDYYPPMKFKGEERFDHWVAEGVLHREVVDEPLDPPYQTPQGQTWNGHRTIYYTPKGEEWRIPAMKLIFHASGKPAAGTNISSGSRACCSAMWTGRTTGGSRRGSQAVALLARHFAAR